MDIYSTVLRNATTGAALPGVPVSILNADRVTLATIFEPDGVTPKPTNPFNTDLLGRAQCAAASGKYYAMVNTTSGPVYDPFVLGGDVSGEVEFIRNKGQPNGYAPLDGTGKVPASFINISGSLTFSGLWAANTGDPPSLTPGVDHYWIVIVAGNTSLSGINTWNIGDQAVYLGSGTWERIPAIVPPASAIPNDSTVSGASVKDALNSLQAALQAIAPSWAGANTEIGAITDTDAENVVDARAVVAGVLLPNCDVIGEMTTVISGTHAAKHTRLCVAGATSRSLKLDIPQGATGISVHRFVLHVRSGTLSISESTASLNNEAIYDANNGPVSVDFGASSASLEARAWVDDSRDSLDVSVRWRIVPAHPGL